MQKLSFVPIVLGKNLRVRPSPLGAVWYFWRELALVVRKRDIGSVLRTCLCPIAGT